jgi:hypothetical protein
MPATAGSRLIAVVGPLPHSQFAMRSATTSPSRSMPSVPASTLSVLVSIPLGAGLRRCLSLATVLVLGGILSAAPAQAQKESWHAEPLVGIGQFWGVGAFSTNLNLQAAPSFGMRVAKPLSPQWTAYAEYAYSAPEELPPPACTEPGSCPELRGRGRLGIWSVGVERDVGYAPVVGSPAFASIGIGVAHFRSGAEARPRPYRQAALALGAGIEHELAPWVALRPAIVNSVSIVSTEALVGFSVHTSVRLGVQVRL